MKSIASITLAAVLTLTMVTGASALEVPTDITVQNLNGSQQLIKTYTLPPGSDPQQLIEEPFDQDGLPLHLCGHRKRGKPGVGPQVPHRDGNP